MSASERWRVHFFSCETCVIGDLAEDDVLCADGQQLRDAMFSEWQMWQTQQEGA